MRSFTSLLPTATDPLGQRFRVDLCDCRGEFVGPGLPEVPASAYYLLRDIDRNLWGLFPMPIGAIERLIFDYGPHVVLTEQPIALSGRIGVLS